MSRSSTESILPLEPLLDGFVGYLRRERGVSPATVDAYASDVRRFLTRHGGASNLCELTAAEVSKAVLAEVAGWSPAPVRRYAASLRAFLRYCHLVGLIDADLSAAALPVSGRRRSLLPQGISEAQPRVLLRSCDRRRATGLRASEVAALRLDDIDWRAGLVTVHGKRDRVDQLPLPVDVGEAIAGYLRRGRPRTAVRQVFVRAVPPQVGLTRCGVSHIVLGAARRAAWAHCARTGCGTPPPATCCAPAGRWPRSGRCCGTARWPAPRPMPGSTSNGCAPSHGPGRMGRHRERAGRAPG